MRPFTPLDPVFLLAPARSCSSVVATVLGRHPRVYGFPELRLFVGDSIETVMQLRQDRPVPWSIFARGGLVRAVAQLLVGSQSEHDVNVALGWLEERSDWAPRQVYDLLLTRVAPKIGLEKSPDTTSMPANLKRCVDAYPTARYVHLTRHPVTTIASMIRHWNGIAGIERTPAEAALVGARAWFNSHRRICTLRDQLPRARFLRLRAEDVVADPEPACRRFAAWLGLEVGAEELEAMLHPELSPYARLGPRLAPGGNDPGFLSDPRLRVGKMPEPEVLPEEWGLGTVERSAISRLAEHLGYRVRAEVGHGVLNP